MPVGDHQISPQEIRDTANIIDKAVTALTTARNDANKKSTDLTESGAWKTPKASEKFHGQWSEYNTGLTKVIDVGPDFVKWLRQYADDAENFDTHYG